jgi:hypothetical protein
MNILQKIFKNAVLAQRLLVKSYGWQLTLAR